MAPGGWGWPVVKVFHLVSVHQRPCIAHRGRCLTLRCRKDKARREETSNRSCSKLFLTEPPPWPPKPFQLEQRPTGSRSGKPTLLPGKAKGLGQGPLPPRLAPTPPRQRPAPTASLASGLQTPAQPTLSGGPTSPGLATVPPPLGSSLPETSGPRERLGHGHGASSGFTGFAPYLPTP